MLEVITKFICFLIMHTAGYYIIKNVTNNENKDYKKASFYIILLALIIMFISSVQYTIIYTIAVFLLNIVVYKKIFKLELSQSVIATSIFMTVLVPSDVIVTTILRIFYTQAQIRAEIIPSLLANTLIATVSVMILKIKMVNKLLRKFYDNVSQKKVLSEIVFFLLLIIGFCCLAYNCATNSFTDKTYFANIVAIIIFTFITMIFIQSKNNYKKLSGEYDSLFSYVQNFEDWIEKEQLNRHEYKNQLAVLRMITKEKKVISKIDEILEDNINIEDEVVSKLKELPKGGLKGLMYYKAAIAQKQKIKLVVDVSLKRKSYLKSLEESQLRTLCKLIGIYFDNAIEAALTTRKKYILLEIYELSDKVNIVISNTFEKTDNFDLRHEKGITSKGEGHGNGLYFASNILSRNKWLEAKNEIIDGYYIQTLSIKKLD